jgi:alpha-1,2-mannosyltransferase
MTALSAAILLIQSLAHGHLSGIDEYDDGVYFGSAMQLVHGSLPYRNFGFIQPPFIAVALSPFALAAHVVGTARAFEAARLFVVAIAATNTALVGILMRRRPLAQVAVAMGVMAVYPGAVSSAQTVLLEPVLVCLCLLGLITLFDGDGITLSPNRVVISGVCFGLATSTKLWALGPVVIIAILLWRHQRLRQQPAHAGRFLAGASAGFWLVCIPFFVGSPRNFINQVFITQAVRSGGGYGIPERILDLSGIAVILHFVTLRLGFVVAVLLAIAAGAMVYLAYRRNGPPLSDLELASLCCAGGVAVVLVMSPTYYYHYSGFEVPFLALTLSCIGGRLLGRMHGIQPAGVLQPHRMAPVLLMALAPTLLFLAGAADVARILAAKPAVQVSDALSDAIPSRGCVLYVDPSIALLDNRYTSDVSSCPDVIDYLGEERVLDHGLSDNPSDTLGVALQNQMMKWVESSDALVVASRQTSWGPAVVRYVDSHFEAKQHLDANTELYVRTGQRG